MGNANTPATTEDGTELVPQPHGGALRRGSQRGNTPGPGRPSNEFKERMRAVASGEEALEYLRRCAMGEYGPGIAIRAQRYAAERGYGKVPQEVTGKNGEPLDVTIILGGECERSES